MHWYFIILIFFLNILFGVGLFYALLIIIFHPKRKKHFLGIQLPIGIIYKLKNKLTEYIAKQFEIYLESNPDELHKSKPKEFAENISRKITDGLSHNKWFKYLPNFLANPILKLVKELSYYFFEELLCSFIPSLAQKYKIKEKIFELLSDENIHLVELKAKFYLTKPLVIIGAIFGFIFGVFNMILMFIF